MSALRYCVARASISVTAVACVLVACSCQTKGSPSDADAGAVCTGNTSACEIPQGDCGKCPATWSDALADRSFCVPSCGYQYESLADCGEYQRWTLSASDCSLALYYRNDSGELVAGFAWCDTLPTTCTFGPSCFTQPATCAGLGAVNPCGDGGANGGTD
jgi:hypothetical protein